MNISSVSSGSNASISSYGDNAIKLLMKQKEQLQEQIQKTNESKMDAKTKQETIAQLEQQIQDIDAQIQQRQREKLTPKQNQDKDNNQQSAENQSNANTGYGGDGTGLTGMSDLIQADAAYTQVKAMNGIKNGMDGKKAVFNWEAKRIEQGGHPAKYQRNEVQKIDANKQSLTKRIGEAGQDIQEHLKEASRNEKEEKDTSISNEKDDANSISNLDAAPDERETVDGEKTGSSDKEHKAEGRTYRRIDVKI